MEESYRIHIKSEYPSHNPTFNAYTQVSNGPVGGPVPEGMQHNHASSVGSMVLGDSDKTPVITHRTSSNSSSELHGINPGNLSASELTTRSTLMSPFAPSQTHIGQHGLPPNHVGQQTIHQHWQSGEGDEEMETPEPNPSTQTYAHPPLSASSVQTSAAHNPGASGNAYPTAHAQPAIPSQPFQFRQPDAPSQPPTQPGQYNQQQTFPYPYHQQHSYMSNAQPYPGPTFQSETHAAAPPQSYPPPPAQQQAYGYPPGYAGYPYTSAPNRFAPDETGQQPPHPPVVFARTSDPRISRPKIKLTYEDKRRICEIAKSNTSLRQEDIAQQYGVDRSTISKILISSHRWMGPPQIAPLPIPKPVKSGGGRFPAIEQRMHEWMDAQHAAGYEIRDNVAREKAKEIARMMGFTEERFKASAKWLDKFKERRRQNGQRASVTASFECDRPVLQNASDGVPVIYSDQHQNSSLPFSNTGGYYGSGQVTPAHSYSTSASASPLPGAHPGLSRSHSSATLASSESSGYEAYHQYSGRVIGANKSESDLLSMQSSTASDVAVSDALSGHSRQRSRSSPQARPFELPIDARGFDPLSGRVPRLQTAGLQRHNSLQSRASPSPRRPIGLHRSNSSTSGMSMKRSNRPTSLAASAFGLTPMSQDDSYSPQPSPSAGQPLHRAYDPNAMQPFMSSMSGMAISPGTLSSAGTLSSSSSTNSITNQNHSHPPHTPVTHTMFNQQVMDARTVEASPSGPQPPYFGQATVDGDGLYAYGYPNAGAVRVENKVAAGQWR